MSEENNQNKTEELLQEINNKLEAVILLNCLKDLSGIDKLNILKHSVGIKPAARILGKDKSYFKKKLKKEVNKNDDWWH